VVLTRCFELNHHRKQGNFQKVSKKSNAGKTKNKTTRRIRWINWSRENNRPTKFVQKDHTDTNRQGFDKTGRVADHQAVLGGRSLGSKPSRAECTQVGGTQANEPAGRQGDQKVVWTTLVRSR